MPSAFYPSLKPISQSSHGRQSPEPRSRPMSVQTAPIALSASAKPATALVAVPSSIAPVASARAGAYTARLHTALEAIAPLWRRFETDGAATAYQRLDWTGRVVDH